MARRAAPAFAILAILAAAAGLVVLPRETPGAGWLFLAASPERALALAGLGLALGAARHPFGRIAAGSLLAGLVLGVASRHSALWPLLSSHSVYPRLRLLGPSACLLSGAILVLKEPWRSRGLPLAALWCGAALALSAALNDPDPDRAVVTARACLGFLALVALAALLRRQISGRWIALAERIAGSWILTIGLLLAGLAFAPVRTPEPALAPPAAAFPGAPFEPGGGSPAPPFGAPAMPRGTD